VTSLARIAFAVLVVATAGGFLVTQRLKAAPSIVQGAQGTRFFSPNGNGVRENARVSFRLKRSDDVTVAVISDESGDTVRRLSRPVSAPAYRRVGFDWDGRTDEGEVAPDGRYLFRIGLREQGRSVTLPNSVLLDTAPPQPVITSIGPNPRPGPEFLPAPGVEEVRVRFEGPTHQAPEFLVYRTDVEPATVVARFRGEEGSNLATWRPRRDDGERLRAGTYMVAVRTRDRAGNVGSSPSRLPPRPTGVVRGTPGITVRYLAAQAPLTPVAAGEPVDFYVDARQEPYTWRVRRVGSNEVLKRGRKTSARLRMQAPGGESGVYLLELRTERHSAAVPFMVNGRERRRVLVVVPAITWQGRNPVDDSGNGLPDVLEGGGPVRLNRPFVAGGLPSGFTEKEAPLLVHLDRAGLRYDLTTDVALASGEGPGLGNRPGVLLAGDHRWVPPELGERLERYVREGGRVASLGTDSLRRSVRLAPRSLREPSEPEDTDVLGSRLREVVRERTDLTIVGEDRIGLFATTDGLFPGWEAYEETLALEDGARLEAAAGPEDERPVILAYRLGEGLVVRTGLPDWSARLGADYRVAEIMRRAWTLLSR
jgi:hypothetical protein